MVDHIPTAQCVAGQRCGAWAPDTLDLAERMKFAIHTLTNVGKSDEKWSLAFNVELSRRPAVLRTNHITDAYWSIAPKFMEASSLSSGFRQSGEPGRRSRCARGPAQFRRRRWSHLPLFGEIPCKRTIRGSNVIAMDPFDIASPLFAHPATDRTVERTRFIPDIRVVAW